MPAKTVTTKSNTNEIDFDLFDLKEASKDINVIESVLNANDKLDEVLNKLRTIYVLVSGDNAPELNLEPPGSLIQDVTNLNARVGYLNEGLTYLASILGVTL